MELLLIGLLVVFNVILLIAVAGERKLADMYKKLYLNTIDCHDKERQWYEEVTCELTEEIIRLRDK